jgi:arylsulfatase A-like enzyme
LALFALVLPGCRATPPSIVVITLDTVRRDHVGVYHEGPSLTPHLDALAAEGLVHDAAYTTMPTTGPAHVSLFTGLYPSRHGVRRNGERLAREHAPREVARRLLASGYVTAAFVTSRLAEATGLGGFDTYDAPREVLRPGVDAARAAVAWLEVEPRRPVFIWLHLYDAHSPYGSADEKRLSFPVDQELYGWVEGTRFASAQARQQMTERYARGVRSADEALGLLVEGVRARLQEPALFVVVADHGESLDEHLDDRGYGYDHGEFLDAESVHIPLVVAGPEVVPGRSSGAVSIRDLYTTLLEAAGIGDRDAATEGRRDLRRSSAARRVVGIERRSFRSLVPELVRQQAGAASDGTRLVVVGEDGALGASEEETDPGLVASARRRALGAAARSAASEISPQIREDLRALGYVE